MNRTKKGKYEKYGKGSITIERKQLGRLRIKEFEHVVSLIKTVGQSLVGERAVEIRTTLLSWGNPAVIELDVKKMNTLSYKQLQQEMLKLEDVYAKAVDEVDRG